jgi:hypothetical protein
MRHSGLALLLLLCVFVSLAGHGQSPPATAAQATVANPTAAAAPRQALDHILARPEFRILPAAKPWTAPGWWKTFTEKWNAFWKQIGDAFNNVFRRVFGNRRIKTGSGNASFWPKLLSGLPYILITLLIALVLYLIGLLISRLTSARQHRVADAENSMTGDRPNRRAAPTPWDTTFAEAERLWAEGNQREALRVLLRASLLVLHARNVLRYDETRTNGEVLRELRRLGRTQAYDALRPLARAFDRAWYGFLAVSDEDYSRAAAGTRALRDHLAGGDAA